MYNGNYMGSKRTLFGGVIATVACMVMIHATPVQAALGTDWTEATSSAAWSARADLGVTTFDNKLWVMGGDSKNDVWYSSDGITWTEATSSAGWSGRRRFGLVAFNNKLWVMGGYDGSTYHNDVWYSSDGINWTEATSSAPWAARDGLSALAFDNKLWVMGGYNGTRLNDVWYSSDGITWTEATSSAGWSARYNFGATSFDNKLWVISGQVNTGYTNDVWYSSDGITWTEATSSAPWAARADAGLDTLDGRLWLVGGSASGVGLVNDVWYSSDGINWTEATSSAGWPARSSFSTSVFSNKLWVMGGYDHIGQSLNDVWYSALPSSNPSPGSHSYILVTPPKPSVGAWLDGDMISVHGSYHANSVITDEFGYMYKQGSDATTTVSVLHNVPDGASFNQYIDDLACGSTYTIMAYARNSVDTTLSNAVTVATPACSGPSSDSSGDQAAHGGGATQAHLAVASTTYTTPPTSTARSPIAPTIRLATPVRDLTVGDQGEDVQTLQQLLNANGFALAASGPGAPGAETDYFGTLTKQALARYQAAHGISPTQGYFGPITRASMTASEVPGRWW